MAAAAESGRNSTDSSDYAEISDAEPLYSSVDNQREFEVERSRLVVGELLGVGQFGDVFRGTFTDEKGVSRGVAVKTCKLDTDALMADTFLNEAGSMQRIQHPHIIELIGVCSQPPVWIVMELAQHGELRAFLREHRTILTVSTLVSYCLQLGLALAHLETIKCVHRDVAARNVLVSAPDCIKLADFGLSRWVDDQCYYTASKGKMPIKWMAPESINFRRFTHSTDVWMYGVCMWEILSRGDKPFPGVDNAEVVERLERGERLPLPPLCPLPIYAVMYDCWIYKSSGRPTFSTINSRLRVLLKDDARRLGREPEQRTHSYDVLSDEAPCKPARCAPLGALQLPEALSCSTTNFSCCSPPGGHADPAAAAAHRPVQRNHSDPTLLRRPSDMPAVPRSESVEKIELDRSSDAVYSATMRLLQVVVELSAAKDSYTLDFVGGTRLIGAELKTLLTSVDALLPTLPASSHNEISMARTTLNADMTRLVHAVKLVLQYASTVLVAQYRTSALSEAHVLAVDVRSLLDAVDSARKRLVWEQQRLHGGTAAAPGDVRLSVADQQQQGMQHNADQQQQDVQHNADQQRTQCDVDIGDVAQSDDVISAECHTEGRAECHTEWSA